MKHPSALSWECQCGFGMCPSVLTSRKECQGRPDQWWHARHEIPLNTSAVSACGSVHTVSDTPTESTPQHWNVQFLGRKTHTQLRDKR
jgi:hypothetical protein